MSLLQALILGVIQGLTEYIPVSSSAHLVLFPWLVGWPDPPFTFDVLVQWGTLVGVLIYFWRDLGGIVRGVVMGLISRQPFKSREARLGWYIVVGTLPAVVFGFLFKDTFEAAFSQPPYVAGLLFGTAIILLIAEWVGRRQPPCPLKYRGLRNNSDSPLSPQGGGLPRTMGQMGWLDALYVGLWQVVALLPGISRSGATISGAMQRGVERPAAARFSFLLSVPALLGAGLLAIMDLVKAGELAAETPALVVGFVAAGVSGYLCIRWLLSYLQRHRLTVFAAYCALFGAFCLAAAWVRG